MMTSANERTTRLTAAQANRQIPASAVQRAGWHPATAGAGHVRHLRPRQRHGHGTGVGRVRFGAALLPAVQRAVHGAYGGRFRPGQAPPGHPGLHHLHRTRRHEHDHGRRGGHHQPFARAPLSLGHLRQSETGPGAAATGAPFRRRRERQRLLSTGEPFFRPHHPAGADSHGSSGSHAGVDRPGGNRSGHPLPVPGRPAGGLRFSRPFLRGEGMGGSSGACRTPSGSGRRWRC